MSTEKGRELSKEDYWELRDYLVTQKMAGKGRGKGGSLRRLTEPKGGLALARVTKREANLYAPFESYVRDYYVGDKGIRQFVLQVTARRGSRKRNTGGKWTQPDLALVAVRAYTYTPGRHLEVLTFEVKPDGEFDVAGVFETASHSVFSHKSYLAIHCPNGRPDDQDFERLELLCGRFGVGLLIFSDVKAVDTYEELLEPERKTPDPTNVDQFLDSQLTEPNKRDLLQLLR
ncbi:MAG: hypothetical protein FJ291_31985 [Planctomycetes bacterium]|nr:hypothetical protein [Planctomycetota bacterium]